MRQQQVSELGDPNAAPGALEQLASEPAFEVLDPTAEQRLRDVELLGCGGEAAPLGDRSERLQVSQQVHSRHKYQKGIFRSILRL